MAVTVTTSVKRSFLRDAYDASVAAGNTLYAQLRIYEAASRAAIGTTGQTVAATSAGNAVGSRSVSFFAPNMGGLNPSDLLAGLSELVDLHDYVLGILNLTDDVANRLAIKNEMLGLLVACRELGPSSFAGLRCA